MVVKIRFARCAGLRGERDRSGAEGAEGEAVAAEAEREAHREQHQERRLWCGPAPLQPCCSHSACASACQCSNATSLQLCAPGSSKAASCETRSSWHCHRKYTCPAHEKGKQTRPRLKQFFTQAGCADAAQAMGRVVGSLSVVTCKDGDAESAMLASWLSQASFDPPGLTIAVKRDRAVESLLARCRPSAMCLYVCHADCVCNYHADVRASQRWADVNRVPGWHASPCILGQLDRSLGTCAAEEWLQLGRTSACHGRSAHSTPPVAIVRLDTRVERLSGRCGAGDRQHFQRQHP